MRTRFVLALAAITLIVASSCTTTGVTFDPADQATTIILIRHAERFNNPDPIADTQTPLNTEGLARAQTLNDVLSENGVDAIYCTDLLRNRQTVAPLAETLGLTPNLINPALYVNINAAAQTVLDQILTDHPGEVVLFCGNRGSVAGTRGITDSIYRQLGGTGASPDRYQDMYIAVVPPDGDAHFIKTIYGPESSLD